MRSYCTKILVFASIFAALPLISSAQESRLELGLNGNVTLADGEPSNDILGGGVVVRYVFGNNWFIGLGLEEAKADFERPYKIVGLEQDSSVKTVDASYTSSMTLLNVGKLFGSRDDTVNWFVALGAGRNEVTVDDATGPVQGGGNFNIVTDGGTETVVLLSLGLTQRLSDTFALNYQLRFGQHMADWKVRDTVSGNTGTVDDYSTHGVSFGLIIRL